jgi:hypothetical protein
VPSAEAASGIKYPNPAACRDLARVANTTTWIAAFSLLLLAFGAAYLGLKT